MRQPMPMMNALIYVYYRKPDGNLAATPLATHHEEQ
jgi:hypothetical protein